MIIPYSTDAPIYHFPKATLAVIAANVAIHVAWSSTTPDGEPNFKRERLLETLTLYWLTGTIATSLLPYWNYRHSTDSPAVPTDDPSPVPTTIAIFGGERVPFPKPPRPLAERYFTIAGWEEYDGGGHFPAVAEPGLLAESLRNAFRPLREAPG